MTDINARLQHFLNESEIRSILIRERFHRDHGEWDEWRNTYHPDNSKTEVHTSLYETYPIYSFATTQLTISRFHGQIDGFIEMTKNTPGKFFDSFHTVTPAVIDVKSKKALTKSLATVNASFELAHRRWDCVVDVVMITRLEFSEKGWRIVGREAIYRRDRIYPSTPQELVDEVNRDPDRRPSCRNLDWLAHHGGKAFDRNVLGFDRPEGASVFSKKGEEWLKS